MTEPQELSIEERIRRNDAVRDLTRSLKTETESRLQDTQDDIQARKLDEDHVIAQTEFKQEVTRAVNSGTISEAKAAMLLAAAGVQEPVTLEVPLLTGDTSQGEEPPTEATSTGAPTDPVETKPVETKQDSELAAAPAAPVSTPKQMVTLGGPAATGEEK